MGQRRNTTEELQSALDACTKYGGSWRASKEVKIPASTLDKRHVKALAAGLTPSPDINPFVPKHVKGTSTLYDAQGNVRLQWVKEEREKLTTKLNSMAEELAKDLPRTKYKPTKKSNTYHKELLNCIPLGDPHFGSYIYSQECGHGRDFDLEIARRDLCDAVEYLVDQGPPADELLIVNLGDFFHYDTVEGTTTAGTAMDIDSRLSKMIQTGVCALRACIEAGLKKHRMVSIMNSHGNHDETLAQALNILLEHVYEKNPRVVVYSQPTKRHYKQHGNTLIGVTHGHKVKEERLPLLMATENSTAWGNTTHRYFWRGHYHTHKVTEYNGCQVETWQTLSPSDEFASTLGLLSQSSASNVTMHKKYGEVSRIKANIHLLRDLKK